MIHFTPQKVFTFFRSVTLLVLSSVLFSSNLKGNTEHSDGVRSLLNLLDYIGRDYARAISFNGAVLDSFEWAEMKELSAQAEHAYRHLNQGLLLPDSTAYLTQLELLNHWIREKAFPSEVQAQALLLTQQLQAKGLVSSAPDRLPDLQKGRVLYAKNCASCHGDRGMGDGFQGRGLEPEPSVLSHRDPQEHLKPFAVFNTVRSGVPGTAMLPFQTLTDDELWDLSYFVSGLSLGNESALAALLQKALQGLEESQLAWEENDHAKALIKARQAYLDAIEPAEPILRGHGKGDRVLALEQGFTQLFSTLRLQEKGAMEQYQALQGEIRELILPQESKGQPLWLTALLSGSILIREGLEALLVLITILGALRAMKTPGAEKYLHAGWVLAVVLGVLCWFLAHELMKLPGQNRELLEGIVALLAVAVLVHLGLWFHSHREMGKWKAFVDKQVRRSLSSGRMWMLGLLSFFVVFREAFESVLFLSSVKMEAGESGTGGLLLGLVSAAVVVSILGVIMLKYAKRLPLGTLFKYSSVMLLLLAVILTGKGLHSLQESGLLTLTHKEVLPRFPLLGMYPTVETIISQSLVAGAAFLIIRKGKKQ